MKKTLKLDHQLAEDVRQGVKASTWRIYDDKNISVNDELEFIDKVDADDPSTWVSFAGGRVDRVLEKRLGDIDDTDFEGHSSYESREAMLAAYQEYYGPEVTYETPVKIIHFTLHKLKDLQQNRGPTLTEAKLYADGGSRGNPGPSASGFAILDMSENIVVKKGVYLGITTNNQAEYLALKLGLEEARARHVRKLHVYMDSMLVVNQMKGVFKVKNRDLWPIHEAIQTLLPQFEYISFSHVPRELNKVADAEVNNALDAAASTQ
jgi:ribonuclease HI